MSLLAKIESLLFVSAEPLSVKFLTRLLDAKKSEVESALDELQKKYRQAADSGMIIVKGADSCQMVTSPKQAALVAEFLKSDLSGELTEPSLETLTIIAYRGPITKAELEQIRGVNCSLILRNLQMRGLITREENKAGLAYYEVTPEFIKYLGVSAVQDLPDYAKLHQHATLNEVLQSVNGEGI
ncbi:MAG: SMC-Scp complex subunit ScpB [Patescibacteria group bacterium]